MFWTKKEKTIQKYKSLNDFEINVQSLMYKKNEQFVEKIKNIQSQVEGLLKDIAVSHNELENHIKFHVETFNVSDWSIAMERSLYSQNNSNTVSIKDKLCSEIEQIRLKLGKRFFQL